MPNRMEMLREIIGECRDEREVEATRLDNYRVERAKLELSREILLEHGEVKEAEQLKPRIHDLDHKIQAAEQNLARLDRLVEVYQTSLNKLEEASGHPA